MLFFCFFLMVCKITLISTPGTRFPRAVREPPRRFYACGVSPGLAFPAGVSRLPFQSNLFEKDRTAFVYKLDNHCLPTVFMKVCKMGTLISTPGTRFPRAVREPPRRFYACGVSPGLAFPAGVSRLPFQSNLF
ncbi:hypothetical protein SAMN05878482_106192 [Peribacillus simplex]|uniref:Uncharacterized protein n=1 Tax=Peribacillus simplex TaxID=1478 RepID=A0A9X8RC51_9BACI|nr:hypothetical protein SAMN05878482_106192 [Peribacillus simplex]